MRVITKAIALGTILAVAGCGSAAVSRDQLEQRVKQALASVVGREPERIDCPSELDAKVGASLRCILSDGGTRWGVTVTVTKVDGSDVLFDANVDDEPLPSEQR